MLSNRRLPFEPNPKVNQSALGRLADELNLWL